MDTSKKVQAHYKIKEREFDVFFDQLTFEYKLLKKLTHECQAKCFDKAESTRKQSEQCARTCLNPYLYVRKQVGDKLQQCDQLFQQQEPKCIEDKDLDGCYQGLIAKLRLCLHSNLSFSKEAYKLVFKEFD